MLTRIAQTIIVTKHGVPEAGRPWNSKRKRNESRYFKAYEEETNLTILRLTVISKIVMEGVIPIF